MPQNKRFIPSHATKTFHQPLDHLETEFRMEESVKEKDLTDNDKPREVEGDSQGHIRDHGLHKLEGDSQGVCVESLHRLCIGVLAHIMPELRKAKVSLAELTENQRILIETLEQENNKFQDCSALQEVIDIMHQAKAYQSRLVFVKKEMLALHEKSAKLKRRALKLQQQKQKENLEKAEAHERMLEREQQLIARPAKS